MTSTVKLARTMYPAAPAEMKQLYLSGETSMMEFAVAIRSGNVTATLKPGNIQMQV